MTLGSSSRGKYGISAGLLFTINSRLGFRVWVRVTSQATKVLLRLILQLLHDPLIPEKLGNYGTAVYCGNGGGVNFRYQQYVQASEFREVPTW